MSLRFLTVEPSLLKNARWLFGAAVILLALFVLVGRGEVPAYAEGFFQQVFGGTLVGSTGPSHRRHARKVPRILNGSHDRLSGRHPYRIGRADYFSSRKQRKYMRKPQSRLTRYKIPRQVRPQSGKTYRTMCVRECDGYYFPISFAVSRNNLARDAAACKSSCGAPARLYVYANPGGKVDEMISYRDGKPYKEMKNAFLYRTRFVASCRCRPDPWTAAARERFKRFAALYPNPRKALAVAERKMWRKRKLARLQRRPRRHSRYLKSASRRKNKYYMRSLKRVSRFRW